MTIALTAEEREALLKPCVCGHTINDHGSLIPCWLCAEDEGECAVDFEALLCVQMAEIVAARVSAALAPIEAALATWQPRAGSHDIGECIACEMAADIRAALSAATHEPEPKESA